MLYVMIYIIILYIMNKNRLDRSFRFRLTSYVICCMYVVYTRQRQEGLSIVRIYIIIYYVLAIPKLTVISTVVLLVYAPYK
jgi:hypothetical protein